MILSAHQPAYMPWLGYFDKISKADMFVFLDHVQYEKNSFINRNLIKTPQGTQWLTIPVRGKGHLSNTLKETLINNSLNWREKHLKALELNYKKVFDFEMKFNKIKTVILYETDNLSDYCFNQLDFWLSELNITTKIIRSSELDIVSKKSDLILELCKNLQAKKYISGRLGSDYLNEQSFEESNIKIEYQDFSCTPYKQLWGGFIENLSILDWWFNN